MQINLIAIGKRMPSWVEQGYYEYAKRMPTECRFNLIEVAMPKRQKHINIEKLIQQEGQALLDASKPNDLLIALDVKGKQIDTPALATWLHDWRNEGRNISLLIGGPDGLSQECLDKAEQHWSLSKLTLPHPLVRIMLSEQLYRAWSILSHHPYHR